MNFDAWNRMIMIFVVWNCMIRAFGVWRSTRAVSFILMPKHQNNEHQNNDSASGFLTYPAIKIPNLEFFLLQLKSRSFRRQYHLFKYDSFY